MFVNKEVTSVHVSPCNKSIWFLDISQNQKVSTNPNMPKKQHSECSFIQNSKSRVHNIVRLATVSFISLCINLFSSPTRSGAGIISQYSGITEHMGAPKMGQLSIRQ